MKNFLWSDKEPLSKFEAWVYILMKTNWCDGEFELETKTIIVKRGSFVTSIDKLCHAFRWGNTKTRNYLKKLESKSMIVLKSTNKYTLLEVVNYKAFQDNDFEKDKQNNNQKTNEKQTKNKPETNEQQQYNKGNKENKENKGNNSYVDIDKPMTKVCPHQKIIALYHKILPELTNVVTWTKQRQGYLKTRWSEDISRQNSSYWTNLFYKIKESDFLMGRVNSFKADLEWIVRPTNFVKIIEGKYDNKVNDKKSFLDDLISDSSSDTGFDLEI